MDNVQSKEKIYSEDKQTDAGHTFRNDLKSSLEKHNFYLKSPEFSSNK